MECVCPKMPWVSANNIPLQITPRMTAKISFLFGLQSILILTANVASP